MEKDAPPPPYDYDGSFASAPPASLAYPQQQSTLPYPTTQQNSALPHSTSQQPSTLPYPVQQDTMVRSASQPAPYPSQGGSTYPPPQSAGNVYPPSNANAAYPPANSYKPANQSYPPQYPPSQTVTQRNTASAAPSYTATSYPPRPQPQPGYGQPTYVQQPPAYGQPGYGQPGQPTYVVVQQPNGQVMYVEDPNAAARRRQQQAEEDAACCAIAGCLAALCLCCAIN